MLVYLAGQTLFSDDGDAEEIAYSEAKLIVVREPRTVENVVFYPRVDKVELELTSGKSVEANYPTEQSALEFEKTLDAQGIRYESRNSGGSDRWSALTYLLPFVLFGAFWIFLLRRHQGKGQNGRRGDLEGEAPSQTEDDTEPTPTGIGKPRTGCYR